MNPFLWLIDTIITLYIWILIASAILSWLVAFNVVNQRNPIVANIGEFLYRITEPALRPIRAFLPNLGGIDISPVILILLLLFLQRIIFWIYVRLFSYAERAAIRHCAVTETAMNPFLWLIDTIITLYIWILIASAILS